MKKMIVVMAVISLLTGMTAVAQAMPMKLLPEPTAAEVACGNLVDEAKLLTELQAWQKGYNTLLRSMENMPDKKVYHVMVDTIWASPLKEKLDTGALEQLLGSVLDREEAGTATPQDKHLLHTLERYGIEAGSVEGCPYVNGDVNFFRSRFTIPPTAEAFLALLQSQPNRYTYSEGWREYSHKDTAKWLIQWEQLMQNAPAQPWREAAQTRYLYLLNLLLFHKDGTVKVQGHEGDSAVLSWRQALQQCLDAHPDTLSAALFKAALDDTDDTSCVVSNAVRQSILARAKAGLSGARGTAGSGKP